MWKPPIIGWATERLGNSYLAPHFANKYLLFQFGRVLLLFSLQIRYLKIYINCLIYDKLCMILQVFLL